MTLVEAQALKASLDLDVGTHNTVVRILPESIDPPREGDNGYDVETTIHGIESSHPHD